MTLPDLLLTADEVTQCLQGEKIYAVTVYQNTMHGIVANVAVQLSNGPERISTGGLLDLAARIGLERVDIVRDRTVRGRMGEHTVELFA